MHKGYRIVIRTTQTDATHKSYIHDVSVAETGGAEVHAHLRRADQISSIGLIRKESHHQILEYPLRMFQLDIRPSGGVGCLLQEDGITRDFGNINGNRQALTGENGIHDGDILIREITRDREDEDPR